MGNLNTQCESVRLVGWDISSQDSWVKSSWTFFFYQEQNVILAARQSCKRSLYMLVK